MRVREVRQYPDYVDDEAFRNVAKASDAEAEAVLAEDARRRVASQNPVTLALAGKLRGTVIA